MTKKLTNDHAVWLLDMNATTVRMQHQRFFKPAAGTTDRQRWCDFFQLVAATERFRTALHSHPAANAEAVLNEFNVAVREELELMRDSFEHADEWLRGQGGRGKNGTKTLYGHELLIRNDGSAEILAVQPITNTGGKRILAPHACLIAVEKALASLALAGS